MSEEIEKDQEYLSKLYHNPHYRLRCDNCRNFRDFTVSFDETKKRLLRTCNECNMVSESYKNKTAMPKCPGTDKFMELNNL